MISLLASTLAIGMICQDSQLPHHTFAETTEGWTLAGTLSPSAKVSITHDAAHLKAGAGSLRFDYSVAKGESNILFLPVSGGVLAKMKSLKFWVQTDYTTNLAVVLQEKDGGRYMARFTAPKAKWQSVELSPSDFSLNTGPDDPKDPDGRLDLDQVEGIALIDLDIIFAQADSSMAALFGVVTGAHALYLSDFQATTEALGETSSSGWIDSYVRPQVQWVGVGGPALTVGTSTSLSARALQLSYHATAGSLVGAIRAVTPGQLGGANELKFKASSEKAIKLLVQVEESDGGKYNAVIEVPGESTVKEISVPFSGLKAADDSKDKNDKLDPELINQVLVIDLTGIADQVAQDNVLWIGKIEVKR